MFDRFVTTELTTVDSAGQPITWPVTPYYQPGDPCIDVTTGLGYPKKANDAQANPLVSLLFSDPTGSGLTDPPTVLVQGSAEVDDRDLEANRERYARESAEKLPDAEAAPAPSRFRQFFSWYFTRIYIHVRPERVYVWPPGRRTPSPSSTTRTWRRCAPATRRSRSGSTPTPEGGADQPGTPACTSSARRYPTAVLSIVCPDGFPFSPCASRSAPTKSDRQIRIDAPPEGAPLQPGLACLTAHSHEPGFGAMQNFQVRGDLVRDDDGWGPSPTSSSAASRHRPRGWRCSAQTPARRCGSAAPPSANSPAVRNGFLGLGFARRPWGHSAGRPCPAGVDATPRPGKDARPNGGRGDGPARHPCLGSRTRPPAARHPTDAAAGGPKYTQPADSSCEITCMTALISARWVNACGKLPRWRPVCASSSSAYRPSGEACASSRSHSSRARVGLADLGQRRDEPERADQERALLAAQPVVGLVDPVAEDEPVLLRARDGDRQHGRADSLVVGRKEPHERDQQGRGVERVGLVVLAEHASLGHAVREDVRRGSPRRRARHCAGQLDLALDPGQPRRHGRPPPSTSASRTHSAWARRAPPRSPGRAAARRRARRAPGPGGPATGAGGCGRPPWCAGRPSRARRRTRRSGAAGRRRYRS